MNINLRTLTGGIIALTVPPTATIHQLKQQAALPTATGVPVDHQLLVWRGAYIDEAATLQELGIREGDNISLTIVRFEMIGNIFFRCRAPADESRLQGSPNDNLRVVAHYLRGECCAQRKELQEQQELVQRAIREALAEQELRLATLAKVVHRIHLTPASMVKLNVGGKFFLTSLSTLCK